MGVKPEDIRRAVEGGNKVLAQVNLATGGGVESGHACGLRRTGNTKVDTSGPADHPDEQGVAMKQSPLSGVAASSRGNVRPARRIRQRTKPLSNKLETEFGAWLRQQVPGAKAFYEQAITVRLCNGVRYSPDWVVLYGAEVFCYEVKGRHVWDDSIVKLKVAASSFPEWYWHLAWKQDGQWQVQGVLP